MTRIACRLLISTAAACALAPAAAASGSTLADAGSYGGFASPSGAAVVDTDLDGRPDVVVADGATATVLRGQGGVALARAAAPLVGGGDPDRVAAADLDGDGHADTLVLDADGWVRPFLSRAGGPVAEPSIDLGAGSWAALGAGDVDGDGRTDVVAGDDVDGTLAIAFQDAGGGFGLTSWSSPASRIVALDVGPLSRGATREGIVLADAGSAAAPTGTLRVVTRSYDGSYDVRSAPLAQNPESVALTHAAYPEIVVGDGAADVFLTGLTPSGSFSAVPVGPLALGDLDGDGTDDLVAPTTTAGGSTLGVHRGQLGGTSFVPDPAPIAVAPDANAPALGDLDGDGRLDAVVAEPGEGSVRVLRNTLAPAAAVAPAELTFGAMSRDLLLVQVRNSGNYPLTVGSSALGGPDAPHFYQLRTACTGSGRLTGEVVLPPGGTCSVAVGGGSARYTHPAWHGTLSIPTSAGTQSVALTVPAYVVPARPVSPALAPVPVRCVVPKLKGLTLVTATKRLKKARCRLGTVHRPKTPKHHRRRHVTLVVVSQTIRAGDRRKVGTKVGVRLVARKAARHR